MPPPPPPLHVICLISGGKDSFFSLLHCLANDHRVVALANLAPPPPPPPPPPPLGRTLAEDIDAADQAAHGSDLNSYMYQTVGHALVPLYATALALPLYRHPIAGTAVNVQKDYSVAPASSSSSSSTPGVPVAADVDIEIDETESLLPLLRTVLAAHPSATALSAGAILSTYQRTRIESVALRLGLVPLSYLWQYPSLPTPVPSPAGLLRDMAAVGMDARIVKVASGGLDEGFLWENVCDEGVRGRVERGVGRFGGSVLGEGGEYETVVVVGGGWKGSVVVGEEGRRVRRGGGGEVGVEFGEGVGRVEMLGGEEGEREDKWRERLRMPGLWDGRFEGLVGEVEGVSVEELEAEKEMVASELGDRVVEGILGGDGMEDEDGVGWGWQPRHESMGERRDGDAQKAAEGHPSPVERKPWSVKRSVVRSQRTLFVYNLNAPGVGSTVEDQMTALHADIMQILSENDRVPGDIVFTTILLRSMVDFATINAIYGTLFTLPNPPARVTVGCGDALPEGADVVLSLVVDMGSRNSRNGLHVQSRSYWAPANIGPYSQAIACRVEQAPSVSIVYVAGQIPLVPASMNVLEAADRSEIVLGAFRRQAVLSLQHLWRIGVAMQVSWWAGGIAFITGRHNASHEALIAWHCWKRMHQQPIVDESGNDDGGSDASGPDAWDKKYGASRKLAPEPEIEHALPDFERLSLSARASPLAAPGFLAVQIDHLPRGCDIEWQSLGITRTRVRLASRRTTDGSRVRLLRLPEANMSFSFVECPRSHTAEQCLDACSRSLELQRAECLRLGWTWQSTIYSSVPGVFSRLESQIVPCKGVWGSGGVELLAGLVLRAGP